MFVDGYARWTDQHRQVGVAGVRRGLLMRHPVLLRIHVRLPRLLLLLLLLRLLLVLVHWTAEGAPLHEISILQCQVERGVTQLT